MHHYLKDHVKPLLKSMKLDVPYRYVRGAFSLNKVAVVVRKDLNSLSPPTVPLTEDGFELVRVTAEMLRDGHLYFKTGESFEDRHRKVLQYVEKGYQGLLLLRGNEVCGDIWYTGALNGGRRAAHPDLAWLGIPCGQHEVYAFDMHVSRNQRGKNLAVLLQGGALRELQQLGYRTVYGYYWADNIPALWVHRTLRFTELKRIKVTKFLFIHHYA